MPIDRRRLFSAIGGAIAFGVSGARADIACQPYDQGGELCEVGLRFAPELRTAQQECEYWCWAACIEAIFALKGFAVTQGDIVRRVYDQPVCAPAIGAVIANAASGDWMTEDGRPFHARTNVLIDANQGIWRSDAAIVAAQELQADRPLIVGALGHAVLLTALTYARNSYGYYEILQSVVRDPWPTNPNRRVLTQMEAQQMFFLAAVQAV